MIAEEEEDEWEAEEEPPDENLPDEVLQRYTGARIAPHPVLGPTVIGHAVRILALKPVTRVSEDLLHCRPPERADGEGHRVLWRRRVRDVGQRLRPHLHLGQGAPLRFPLSSRAVKVAHTSCYNRADCLAFIWTVSLPNQQALHCFRETPV
jgi:hypothetical protein